MRSLLPLLAFILALVVPRLGRAHEVNFGAIEYERPNVVHVKGGAEYAFVMDVGYSRILRVADRPLVLTAELMMPIAMPDFGDYRARVGAQIPIVNRKGGVLAGRVMPTVRGVSTDFNRMTSVGTDVGFVGGYYARRWFVAGELGIDWAVTTHIKHTALFRETVYADVKDGWYANSGGSFYYGVLLGYSPGPVDIIVRVGQSRHLANGRVGFFVVYAMLGINVRFGDLGRRARTSRSHMSRSHMSRSHMSRSS